MQASVCTAGAASEADPDATCASATGARVRERTIPDDTPLEPGEEYEPNETVQNMIFETFHSILPIPTSLYMHQPTRNLPTSFLRMRP